MPAVPPDRRETPPRLAAVDEDEVFDRLTEIEETVPRDEKAERFEELAATMPLGDNGRASFLLAAGEHRQMRGQFDEARRCYELALADGGQTGTPALANLHRLALETGNDPDAASLVAELRQMARRDELYPMDFCFIGETFEAVERLSEAQRWFTMPLSHLDPVLDVGELDPSCLAGRHRVRRALGLPMDRYDQAAIAD